MSLAPQRASKAIHAGIITDCATVASHPTIVVGEIAGLMCASLCPYMNMVQRGQGTDGLCMQQHLVKDEYCRVLLKPLQFCQDIKYIYIFKD